MRLILAALLVTSSLAGGTAAFAQGQPGLSAQKPYAAAPTAILLDGSAVPNGVIGTGGSDPMLWFVSAHRSAIGEVDPASRAVGYMALGHGAKPRALARCENGKLYAVDPGLNVIHEIDPATEQVTRFPMPAGQQADLAAAACTSSNTVVFTGYNGWIGKIDTALGTVVTAEAAGGRGAFAITVGEAGQVWFASYAANLIVKVDPATLKQDVVPMPAGVEGPKSIAMDKDGRIWVTAFRSGRIARYDAGRGSWDAWGVGRGVRPYALITEADGSVLFTDTGRDQLLRFDPASGSVRLMTPLTERGQARALARIGDEVFVTEMAVDRIAVVDTRPRTN